MTMIGLVVAWVVAAAAGFYWWRNNMLGADEGSANQSESAIPARSLNPRQLGPAAAGQLWILRSDPSCEHSRKLNGRRTRSDQAVPLLTVGCRPGQCDCHYQRTVDARRRSRRINEDRREQLRFSTDSDRRESDDRRNDARAWSPIHRAL